MSKQTKNFETIGVNWAQKIEQYTSQVHVILSNACTDGYLALYRRDPTPVPDAGIHPIETVLA